MNPEKLTGTIMVIGAPDTGKSTLAQWLVNRLCQTHQRVGWLDGDIGQTTLSVPATINLAVVDGTQSRLPQLLATVFIGSTSPRGHTGPLLDGLRRLLKLALAAKTTAVVVDTTGMVDAHIGGGDLKAKKIELLQPDTIIALQREGELDHILDPLQTEQRFNILQCNPAEAVVRKSPEVRSRRRQSRFQRYFQSAVLQQIQTGALPLFGRNQPAPMSLMALQDKLGFALALGVVRSISDENMEILTPLTDLSNVAGMQFSALRLDPFAGEEL